MTAFNQGRVLWNVFLSQHCHKHSLHSSSWVITCFYSERKSMLLNFRRIALLYSLCCNSLPIHGITDYHTWDSTRRSWTHTLRTRRHLSLCLNFLAICHELIVMCAPRLSTGISAPLEELKKLNTKLIDLQAAAMVNTPSKWRGWMDDACMMNVLPHLHSWKLFCNMHASLWLVAFDCLCDWPGTTKIPWWNTSSTSPRMTPSWTIG